MIKAALEIVSIGADWIRSKPIDTGRIYRAQTDISKGDIVVIVNEKLWRRILIRFHIVRPRVRSVTKGQK